MCNDILNTEDGGLHPTVWKNKWLFRQSLKYCAATGKCCMPLYTFMRMVSLNWDPDSQEIESVNSVLQAIVKRCPHISLAVLDARVAIRKQLGLGSREDQKKQSHM